MWTLEKAKDILACVQSAALAISIPVAGYWTYTRYEDLLEAERARIEYEKARVETEKSRVESERARTDIERSRAEIEKARIEYEKTSRELSERQPVDVKVTAKQISIPKANRRHVSASIEIANIGNRVHTFCWKDCQLNVSHVLMSRSGELQKQPMSALQLAPAEKNFSVRVMPGEIERVFYLIRLDKPGLYLLTVKLVPNQEGGIGPVSHENHEPEYFTATTHLVVE